MNAVSWGEEQDAKAATAADLAAARRVTLRVLA
jgi:hypothetical protein